MPKKRSAVSRQPSAVSDHSVPSREIYPAIEEMLLHAVEWCAALEEAERCGKAIINQLVVLNVEAG